MDPTRTSKFLRTLRGVGWMLHWRNSTQNNLTSLCLEELQNAKTVILKQVQRKFFWQELRVFKTGQPVHWQSSLATLHPFLKDGLIRTGGRLQQAETSFNDLHPFVVRKCGVLDQFVLFVHEQLQHAGTELRR